MVGAALVLLLQCCCLAAAQSDGEKHFYNIGGILSDNASTTYFTKIIEVIIPKICLDLLLVVYIVPDASKTPQ